MRSRFWTVNFYFHDDLIGLLHDLIIHTFANAATLQISSRVWSVFFFSLNNLGLGVTSWLRISCSSFVKFCLNINNRILLFLKKSNQTLMINMDFISDKGPKIASQKIVNEPYKTGLTNQRHGHAMEPVSFS